MIGIGAAPPLRLAGVSKSIAGREILDDVSLDCSAGVEPSRLQPSVATSPDNDSNPSNWDYYFYERNDFNSRGW